MRYKLNNRYQKYLFIIWTVIVFSWSTSPAQEEKISPVLTIDSSSFNVGEIEEGTPITHTYIIKNKGKGDLKIDKVQPT